MNLNFIDILMRLSEIILDFNLCLINILFKGRSASFQDKMDTEVGCEIFWIFFLIFMIDRHESWPMMEDEIWLNDKMMCDGIIYAMLSIEDSKKYHSPMDWPGTLSLRSCLLSV